MLPLDPIKWANNLDKMFRWANEADRLLSKYRLALEEIAARDVIENEDLFDNALDMREIARDALR